MRLLKVQMRLNDLDKAARDAGLPLREPQRRALEKLCRGDHLLLVWPTGSGKSLCYQLPALVAGDLTLVISPLIALMNDQVAKAAARGWPATCVHSAVSRPEREKRLKKVRDGQIRLLYVTPERFRSPEFREVLKSRRVTLLAVDEAHCISQWGHDFRPDYSRLGEVRRELGEPQTIALTATATAQVQDDILKQLGLEGRAEVLWEGVERPNLHLAAGEYDGLEEKIDALEGWLRETAGPKIVYCTLIRTLEKLGAELSRRGFRFGVYHGELGDRERHRAQNEFIGGAEELMLATPAFGLGVDKPDIRGVAHFEIPSSLESYFQEVGRAGRDGRPSRCRLFYHEEDLTTQMRFIETLTPEPAFVRAVYNLLVSWRDRLKTARLDDLREQLSFKNKHDYRLETSLSFLDRWGVIRFAARRLDRLELLRELTEEDIAAELWGERRLGLQKKLMAMVQWFRSEECRKVGIYAYFGWPDAEPCGFCDRCEENGDA